MIEIKRKIPFLLMAFLCVPLTLSATWVVTVLDISLAMSRVLAVAVYLPFVCLAAFKMYWDVRNWRSACTVSNGLFYAFLAYYAVLFAHRFLSGLEYKENLYYSIVFIGSISLYMLLREHRINVDKQDLADNVIWIALLFILYRLLYQTIGARFFEFSPININLTSGAVALLMPLLSHWLAEGTLSRGRSIVCWLTVAGGIVVIATTGARALFWLMVVTVGCVLVCHIRAKIGLLRLSTALMAGCLVVVCLCVFNIGRARYAVYRETGLSFSVSSPNAPGTPDDEQPDEDQLAAQQQAGASDQMRSELVALGLEQVRLNPWFGTGNVMYETQPREDYTAIQSSHNFLIEALVCYGVVGLIMIIALFIVLIGEAGVFSKGDKCNTKYKIVLLLTLLFFFGFGFVQPTVFNPIICLLFVVTVASIRAHLHDSAVA